MSEKNKKAEENKPAQPPKADELTDQDLTHVVGGTEPTEDEPFLPG